MQLTKHSIKRGLSERARGVRSNVPVLFPQRTATFFAGKGKEGGKEGEGGGKSENDRTAIDQLTAVDWARHVVRYVL